MHPIKISRTQQNLSMFLVFLVKPSKNLIKVFLLLWYVLTAQCSAVFFRSVMLCCSDVSYQQWVRSSWLVWQPPCCLVSSCGQHPNRGPHGCRLIPVNCLFVPILQASLIQQWYFVVSEGTILAFFPFHDVVFLTCRGVGRSVKQNRTTRPS